MIKCWANARQMLRKFQGITKKMLSKYGMIEGDNQFPSNNSGTTTVIGSGHALFCRQIKFLIKSQMTHASDLSWAMGGCNQNDNLRACPSKTLTILREEGVLYLVFCQCFCYARLVSRHREGRVRKWKKNVDVLDGRSLKDTAMPCCWDINKGIQI